MPTIENLPSDPGDLFARLYDLLPDEPFADGRVESWSANAALSDRSDAVRDEIILTGLVSDDLLADLRTGTEEAIFVAMRGIDDALDDLSPYHTGASHRRLAAISTRHATTGRLNDSEPGALLFRCAFPGRPAGVAEKDEFFGLVRVSPEIWKRVAFGVIPNEFDLNIDPWQRAASMIGVGCSPLVESYDEMRIEKRFRSGFPPLPAYRLAPEDGDLRPRIAPILAELDSQGDWIGLMPEATLSPGLLADWRAELRRSLNDPGPLEWILVGTGPAAGFDVPPNRAVLLHRSGSVLLEQDKMHGFTLSRRQLRDWELTSRLGGTVRRVEDITLGTKLQIRESNLGRVAVLICEDLARPDVTELVRSCGVSHIFVPIFSTEIKTSWAYYACKKQTYEAGACVVIATSQAVPRAKEPTAAAWCTCAAVLPAPDRDEWTSEFRSGETVTGIDVHRFLIPGGMTHRSSDFVV